jgi:ribosomal protein L11 methyltransferase
VTLSADDVRADGASGDAASAGGSRFELSADDDPAEGASAGGSWFELSVVADLEAVEAVSEILARHAPGGASVEPAFELVDEGLSARVDVARPAVIRAYLPALDAAAARTAIAEARGALGHLQAFGLRPIGDLKVRVVHEEDWADAWKSHFPVMRVGRRIVIRPTWRRHRRSPGDVVLALDPGMAFGTGLHPTTRLCLEGIEDWADEGRLASPACRLLDVGCGSGILSIAAASLGPASVLAVDTDPIAIEATRANGRRNRVLRRVHARRGSVPTGDGPFDLVVANLIATLLADLATDLRDELRPDGRLLASGIFLDREPKVRAAFESAGLEPVRRREEGDWVALEAIRTVRGDRT